MYREHQERKFHLVLVRLVSHLETKSHRVTLHLEQENSNRWNLNSSVNLDTDLEWFEYWRGFCRDWLLNLGIKEDEMRLRDHAKEELSFYSKATTDIEFLFPFGWGELWGIADRTDYDLIKTSWKLQKKI